MYHRFWWNELFSFDLGGIKATQLFQLVQRLTCTSATSAPPPLFLLCDGTWPWPCSPWHFVDGSECGLHKRSCTRIQNQQKQCRARYLHQPRYTGTHLHNLKRNRYSYQSNVKVQIISILMKIFVILHPQKINLMRGTDGMGWCRWGRWSRGWECVRWCGPNVLCGREVFQKREYKY